MVYIPTNIAIIARNISDLVVLLLFLLSIIAKLFIKSTDSKTEKLLWKIILVLSLLSIANQMYNARCIDWSNYWAFIRFFLLFNVLDIFKDRLHSLLSFVLKYINICFVIQLIIGILQILYPDRYIDLFKPTYTLVELENGLRFTGGYGNEISGYFAHTIHFAYLMLFKIIYIHSKTNRTYWDYMIIMLALIAIHFSGVRAAFMLSLFISSQIISSIISWKRAILLVTPVALISFFLFSEALLKTEFMEELIDTRLGLILYIYVPLLFDSHSLMGYSTCAQSIEHLVMSDPQLAFLPKTITVYFLALFEDVYYGAFILNFGIICLAFIFIFWYQVHRTASKGILFFNKISISISILSRNLIYVMFLLNFVNQTLKVKMFSFVFWTLIFSFILLHRGKDSFYRTK